MVDENKKELKEDSILELIIKLNLSEMTIYAQTKGLPEDNSDGSLYSHIWKTKIFQSEARVRAETILTTYTSPHLIHSLSFSAFYSPFCASKMIFTAEKKILDEAIKRGYSSPKDFDSVLFAINYKKDAGDKEITPPKDFEDAMYSLGFQKFEPKKQ